MLGFLINRYGFMNVVYLLNTWENVLFFHFSCVINFRLAVLDVEFDKNSSPGG